MARRRARIQTELNPADLDEALAHIVLDRWTVDELTAWGQERGYTISRSAWGRFSKELLDRWDQDQMMRLHARAVAQEFGADGSDGALGLSDAAGLLIQKKALAVLADMGDEANAKGLLDLARTVGEVSRARLNTEKWRDTKARARAEALAEMEEELRRELQTDEPELWQRLMAWLESKRTILGAEA